MSRKTYVDIAREDRIWADINLKNWKELGNYNRVIIALQQSAEKFLKGYITENLNYNGKYDHELKRHNLRNLCRIINEECGTTLDAITAKYLGDFYYEARYPGDDYVDINDMETVENCYGICDSIIKTIEELIKINT